MTTKSDIQENENYSALSPKLRKLIKKIWILVRTLKALRRIKVRGLENLRSTPWENRLLLSNHPSFLEPILIPLVGFMPKMLQYPQHNFPWQTPNNKFIEDSGMAFLREIPAIPLKTDENGRPNDSGGIRKILRQMKQSTFLIFPEGTRSSNSDEPRISTSSGVVMGQARDGIGFLVAHAKPTVIPVLVKGADKVLPPHISNPKKVMKRAMFALLFRHRIEVIFGKPLDLTHFWEQGKKPTSQTYQEIGKAIMEAIAALDTNK